MSRPDLQVKLLDRLVKMKETSDIVAAGVEGKPIQMNFHAGRATAFADCIRELEKTIEESK